MTHKGRVSPFGHSRIRARLPAPLDFSQVSTSFIASRRQVIRRVPFLAWSHPSVAADSYPKPESPESSPTTRMDAHNPSSSHPQTEAVEHEGRPGARDGATRITRNFFIVPAPQDGGLNAARVDPRLRPRCIITTHQKGGHHSSRSLVKVADGLPGIPRSARRASVQRRGDTWRYPPSGSSLLDLFDRDSDEVRQSLPPRPGSDPPRHPLTARQGPLRSEAGRL